MTTWPEVPEGFYVVAFDLDGTLAKNCWPDPGVGPLIPEIRDGVLHYLAEGCEVIVYTARPEAHWPRIWRWLKDEGLGNAIYDVTNRKRPDVGLTVDDRCFNPWT